MGPDPLPDVTRPTSTLGRLHQPAPPYRSPISTCSRTPSILSGCTPACTTSMLPARLLKQILPKRWASTMAIETDKLNGMSFPGVFPADSQSSTDHCNRSPVPVTASTPPASSATATAGAATRTQESTTSEGLSPRNSSSSAGPEVSTERSLITARKVRNVHSPHVDECRG